MVEQVTQQMAGASASGSESAEDVPVDPLDGVNRCTAVDLANCPDAEEDLQRELAGEHAESLVDQWWADPAAAQRDWDADLAAMYAQVDADSRCEAVARRAVLDGPPSLEGLAALLEVLDGAPAWTAEQAGTEGFVDELADGAISAFAMSHRLANHLLWLQTRAAHQVAAAWTGRTPSLPRTTRSGRLLMNDQDVLVDGAVATELALAARTTQGIAAYRVEAATALLVEEKLPETAELLQQGLLDLARLRPVLQRTRDLTPDAARAVERLLYATPGVLDSGPKRFVDALDTAVLMIDPDADAKRSKRNRKGRRVSVQTGDDAAAVFTANGPGEAITAAYNGLDAAARYLRADGDPRTLDQLRHDLFVTGCTSGHLPVPADVIPVPAGCVPNDAPAPTVGPAVASHENAVCTRDDDTEAAWFTTTWPDVQVTVNVTVSAETLMGLVNDPGTLQGHGPIPSEAIRGLVRNGVFRCLVVDGEHGTVLGVGKNTFSPGTSRANASSSWSSTRTRPAPHRTARRPPGAAISTTRRRTRRAERRAPATCARSAAAAIASRPPDSSSPNNATTQVIHPARSPGPPARDAPTPRSPTRLSPVRSAALKMRSRRTTHLRSDPRRLLVVLAPLVAPRLCRAATRPTIGA